MSAKQTNRKPGEVETTGHVWDGIEEFNNPLPRWWLWIFYATILWALIYSIAYPAWPMLTRATPGVLGYNMRTEVANEIQRFKDQNAEIRASLEAADLNAIVGDPALDGYAKQAGAALFMTWCAQCHGAGGAGVQASGYPNLLDDDWLWGGDIESIHFTIAHGIRNTASDDARYSQMPAYGEMLEAAEIDQVVNYVLKISGQDHDAALAEAGTTLYADNCAACHAENGTGDRAQGAPNLTDAIWLYGGGKDAVTHSVKFARFGVMPNWNTRLSEADLRSLAVYVHALGGGE